MQIFSMGQSQSQSSLWASVQTSPRLLEELGQGYFQDQMDTRASGPAMKCGAPDTGLSSLLLHMFFSEARRAFLQIWAIQNRRYKLSLRSLGNHSPNYCCSFNSETWIHTGCLKAAHYWANFSARPRDACVLKVSWNSKREFEWFTILLLFQS